jgi:hypothetical protein
LSGHDCTKQWARAPLFLRRGGVDSSSPQRCPTNLWSISRLQNRMQKLPLSPIPGGAWAKTRGDTPTCRHASRRRAAPTTPLPGSPAVRLPHRYKTSAHDAASPPNTHSLTGRGRRQRPISGIIVILLARLPIGARSWGS